MGIADSIIAGRKSCHRKKNSDYKTICHVRLMYTIGWCGLIGWLYLQTRAIGLVHFDDADEWAGLPVSWFAYTATVQRSLPPSIDLNIYESVISFLIGFSSAVFLFSAADFYISAEMQLQKINTSELACDETPPHTYIENPISPVLRLSREVSKWAPKNAEIRESEEKSHP